MDNSVYEDALALCTLCSADTSFDREALNYVSVADIHRKYAYNIYQRGDYDGAINHFLMAETKFKDVLALFPELFPKNFSKFEVYLQDTSGYGNSTKGSGGQTISRAPSAVAAYCEKIRSNIKSLAEKADKLKQHSLNQGNSRANTSKYEDFANSQANLLLTIDPEELIRDAIILDTIYMSALIHCSPPRRTVIVNMLSKPNYCYVDSCSLMIASQGNAYTGIVL